MEQNTSYHPSPLSQNIPESTSPILTSDHQAAEEAYRNFRLYERAPINSDVKITHENSIINLKFLGSGGSKLVYAINDDYAVALLNITSNSIDISLWERMIREEAMLAEQLQKIGLYTQCYEVTTVSFNGFATKALKMPTFSSLANKGQQVRDVKNASHSQYGTSMLFGSLTNLQSKDHWQQLLHGFRNDLVIYYREGLAFESDTFNFVIADTPETPAHDRSVINLITERKQSVHFCFYDFSNKRNAVSEIKYSFLDSSGNVVRKAIEVQVNFLFDKIVGTLPVSLLPIECVNILGGYELLLVPQSFQLQIIPDKTIVLQQAKNTIHAYFINSDGAEEKKVLDLLDLDYILRIRFDVLANLGLSPEQLNTARTKILESSEIFQALKFPESEQANTKITVSENRELVREIVRLCGCHQYSTTTYALDIHSLAKSTLEEIKPWFVNAVINDLIAELEQLPTEVRQARFDVYNRGTGKIEEKPVIPNQYQPR